VNRRAIDVKLFVRDVQEGAGHASLMEKYDLTREQLDEALEILADAGKLPRSSLIPDTSQPSDSAHPIASTCARCGALILADSGECPQCLENEVARLIDEKEEVARASEEGPSREPEEKATTLEFEVAELEGRQSEEAAIHAPASRPKRRWLPAAAGISLVAIIVAAAFFYAGIPDSFKDLWPTQPEKPWPAPVQKSPAKVASAPKPSEPLVIPPAREEPKAPDTHTNPPLDKEIAKKDASAERFPSQSPDPNAEQPQELVAVKQAEATVPEPASVTPPELVAPSELAVQDPPQVGSESGARDETTVESAEDAPPESQYASVAPQELPRIETPDKREDASTAPDQINSALVKAVKEGSLDQARSLIDRGGDVNAEDDQGSSLLLLATKLGNGKLVDFLIKRGADRNRTDKDGFTPLGRACEASNVKIAVLLLTGDESKGAATLFGACEKGRTQWVKLMVEHGADMNARNQQGATPLMVAAGNGHVALVEWLLSNGADTGAFDNKGYTALAWAYSPTTMNVTPFPVQRKIIRLLKHHSPSAMSSPASGN
jgi:uncharacterized protein